MTNTIIKPLCDVTQYGAKGDGVTKDTVAIQNAINQCPLNGIVLFPKGKVFLSGTIYLKSHMTLRIEPGSILRGSRDDSDYPDLVPHITNTQLSNCKKALIYSENVQDVTIEGFTENLPETSKKPFHEFGLIDGNGSFHDHWQGHESTRPMILFLTTSSQVTVRNIQLINSGMWTLVQFENDHVLIDHVKIDSTWWPNRDGIDIVDCHDVVIQNVEVNSQDDSICLKSGSQKGVKNLIVRNSVIKNSIVANAIKLGTASVGFFENLLFENINIEATRQAAMAVESVDGAHLKNIQFQNITFANVGSVFFVLLGERIGSPGIGSIEDLRFNNIKGSTNRNWGSVISGTKINNNTYSITNLVMSNIDITNTTLDNLKQIPNAPLEYDGQYPDPRMWETMPAYGIFLRHVINLKVSTTKFHSVQGDPRQEFIKVEN